VVEGPFIFSSFNFPKGSSADFKEKEEKRKNKWTTCSSKLYQPKDPVVRRYFFV
jgi:hypothetical protein